MAAPPKPWERGTNVSFNQRQANFNPDSVNSFISTQDLGNGGGGGGGQIPLGRRPPLPPRPSNNGNGAISRPMYNGYNSYSSYGGMGSSPYGGYGSYGGLGSYGYGGYNRYGMMGNGAPDENGFIQVAEESSRQAFQSIESIVHAFGSVSMMLESTYHAVYSSFRAVLGVAEHFSRMKSHFAQIFSALAVVRTLRWILRKLLYLIGLRSQDPSRLEAVWRAAANEASSSSLLSEADLKASRSSWPIVMFLGVVFGGPYLIWRLLSSMVKPTASPKAHGWKRGVCEHYAAVAAYTFDAASKRELPFKAGQRLFLAPKEQQPQVRGWLLASNGSHIGLVPANYIKILGLRQGSPQPNMEGLRQGSPQSNVERLRQGSPQSIRESPHSSPNPNAKVATGIPSIPNMKPAESSSNSETVYSESTSTPGNSGLTYSKSTFTPGNNEANYLGGSPIPGDNGISHAEMRSMQSNSGVIYSEKSSNPSINAITDQSSSMQGNSEMNSQGSSSILSNSRMACSNIPNSPSNTEIDENIDEIPERRRTDSDESEFLVATEKPLGYSDEDVSNSNIRSSDERSQESDDSISNT